MTQVTTPVYSCKDVFDLVLKLGRKLKPGTWAVKAFFSKKARRRVRVIISKDCLPPISDDTLLRDIVTVEKYARILTEPTFYVLYLVDRVVEFESGLMCDFDMCDTLRFYKTIILCGRWWCVAAVDRYYKG